MGKIATLMIVISVAVGAISEERCWEVGGAALYWKPCGQAFEYGDDVRIGDVRNLSIRPDYDWGLRLFAATYTQDCCHCWWLDWIYLRTTDGAQKSGTSILAIPTGITLSNGPLAKASLKYRYNRINLRAGRYIARHCKALSYAFAGLRYVDIERKQTVQVTDLTPGLTRSFEKSEFEGAAFEVGAGVEIEEPWNLYAVGNMAGIMGIGRRRYEQRTLTTRFHYAGETACITGLQGLVGVEYRYACNCLWLNVQVNYQLDYYFDALRMLSTTTPTTATRNVGFAGPGFQVAARF